MLKLSRIARIKNKDLVLPVFAQASWERGSHALKIQSRTLTARWRAQAWLVLAAVSLPLGVVAQQRTTSPPVAPAQPAAAANAAAPVPPAATPAAAPNPITLAAVQRGALSCASRIEQVTGYLGAGTQGGALLLLTPQSPDRQLIGLAMELPLPKGISAYATASFAPGQVNGCGATFDSVSYWPSACAAVASQQFAQLKSVRALRKDISVLDGGPAMKVFLMPAGESGCISIKKEIFL